MNGIGCFSKVLEASDDLTDVIDVVRRFRVLQVEEMDDSSVGWRYGRMKTAAFWNWVIHERWKMKP
ncbi:hypothetical protein Hanom_Chr11g01053491 [Helianthus anomalus]